MKISEVHDTLTVTKGPEDGSEFALTTSPVFIGKDSSCLVLLQFDVNVRPIHARASVAKNGYRIRSAEGAPVYVADRRAGMIRSRTLRPGQVIRVGYTELVLGCAPEGLAATSSERWTESDIAWLGRAGISRIAALGRLLKGLAGRLLGGLLKIALEHWIISSVLLVAVLYLFVPQVREWMVAGVQYLRDVLEK